MKIRTLMGIALGTGIAIVLAGCNGNRKTVAEPEVAAVEDAVENQRLCPVMEGMPIDKSIYVDHEGKRVYFCCAGCPATFQADPENYMKHLQEIHADPNREPRVGAHDHDTTMNLSP